MRTWTNLGLAASVLIGLGSIVGLLKERNNGEPGIIMCGIASLGVEEVVCTSGTPGSGNDNVDIWIPYTGVDQNAVINNLYGIVGGDDPTTDTNGIIVITGLSEGGVWDLSIGGIGCDLVSTGAIPAQTCDPDPRVLITEIGDPLDYQNRYVEICNRGNTDIDVSAWRVRRYANGNTTSADVIIPPATNLNNGSCFVFEHSSSNLDLGSCVSSMASGYINGNGNDVYELFNGSRVVDVYGEVGIDGEGEVWEYTDHIVWRNQSVSSPTTSFDIDEWILAGNVYATSGTPCVDITPTDPFFRTRQSGLWRNQDNWEMSPDGASNWVIANTYPQASTSDEIIIQTGHTISLEDDIDGDPNIRIDDTTIEHGGTLDIARTAEVAILDGSGIDLVIAGTLIDRGTSGSGIIDIQGTWMMDQSGAIRKTGKSSVNQYRDNYEGGISSIPPTAHWYYEYDGFDTEFSVSAVGMYYPNLYMVSSDGHYDAGSFNAAFQGVSGGYCVVKGNFEIGTSENGTVKAYNNNMNTTSAMVIMGDMIIAAGNELVNESYDSENPCTSTRGDGTGFELYGNAVIDGSLTINDYSHSDGDCATHNRILRFAGTSPQTISGSGAIVVSNVEVDNSSGVTVDGVVIKIDKTLALQQGTVSTINAGEIFLRTSNNNAILGANEYSDYINGRLRWNATLTGVDYIWPIGDQSSGHFVTLNINAAPGDYTDLLGYYDEGGYTNRDVQCSDMTWYYWENGTGVCSEGTWTFTPSGMVSGWDYLFSINTPDCKGAFETYVIDDRIENPGGVEDNCPNTIARFSHFSEFQHWSISDLLPVTWSSFVVEKSINVSVILRWQTLWEMDNHGFFVEHSIDGKQFVQLDFVKGRGAAHDTTGYSYEHRWPAYGMNYYRLKQVDYNGKHEYSPIRNVVLYKNKEAVKVDVYPNPAFDEITVDINSMIQGTIDLQVIDLTGLVIRRYDDLRPGENQLLVNDLHPGVYYARITHNGGQWMKVLPLIKG